MRAALVLVLVAASGCFYLDGVNTPPVARIARPPGPYHVHDRIPVSAMASTDDDVASLSFEWSAVVPSMPAENGVAETFTVPIDTHDTVRVTLVVFDAHGASASASVDFDVTDVAPTLTVQPGTAPSPQGSYPVSRAIEVDAVATDPDGDTTTLAAVVHPPPAANPNVYTFTGGNGVWTLTPDVAGSWGVVVTADDGHGQTTVKTQTLQVAADTPPCIVATSPAAEPADLYVMETRDPPRRFAIDAVQDDLDPWPAAGTQLGFRWFVDGIEVAGHDLPDLTLDPTGYLPGDTVTLRAEVADRVDRTLPCGPEQPECSIGGDMCLQRVSWKVEIR